MLKSGATDATSAVKDKSAIAEPAETALELVGPKHSPFDPEATAVTYDAWHGYWRLARDGHRADYPFGFGLAYTELAITEAGAVLEGDHVAVTARAENLGARPGVEVVQVYAGRVGAPSKLVGFARVEVAAGTAVEVSVSVPISRLARRDPAGGRWLPPVGPHEVVVGRHAEDAAAHRLPIDLG